MADANQDIHQLLDRIFHDDPEADRTRQKVLAMQENIETVADIFATYRTCIIPPNASVVQVRETEQAMYSACQLLLTTLMRKIERPTDADGSEAITWLRQVVEECNRYAITRLQASAGKHH